MMATGVDVTSAVTPYEALAVPGVAIDPLVVREAQDGHAKKQATTQPSQRKRCVHRPDASLKTSATTGRTAMLVSGMACRKGCGSTALSWGPRIDPELLYNRTACSSTRDAAGFNLAFVTGSTVSIDQRSSPGQE